MLTRVFCVAACAGCAAPTAETVVLRGADRVIGRAALGQQVVMLTNEPALIRIDAESGRSTRQAVAGPDRAKPRLWGLGQIAGGLYSINEFKRLVRLDISASGVEARDVAQLARAAGNLIDTPSGMAVQFAADDPGEPIAAGLDQAGYLAAISAPARVPLGLQRAEEGLLHLLTCSAPPRVLCWTPGSNALLAADDRGIQPLVTIEVIPRIAPTLLIARPTARAIQDALWLGDDLVAVLFQDGDAAGTVLAEFNLAGRMVRQLQPQQPVRLLVSATRGGMLAITESGLLTQVSR